MQYLISGKQIRTNEVLRLGHEEFVALIQKKALPTLSILTEATSSATVIAGGVPAGSRDVVMIVDLKANNSHLCVRSFLVSLPMFEYYEWTVTPLETFSELLQAWSK